MSALKDKDDNKSITCIECGATGAEYCETCKGGICFLCSQHHGHALKESWIYQAVRNHLP